MARPVALADGNTFHASYPDDPRSTSPMASIDPLNRRHGRGAEHEDERSQSALA